MTKTQLIQKLENCTIKTADGARHLIQHGKFTTVRGETVHLTSLHKYHLRCFFKRNRENTP
jgi:hypothetical protein